MNIQKNSFIFGASLTVKTTEVKKTIEYNGTKQKVDFVKSNFTKVIDVQKTFGVVGRAHGTCDYTINGTTYTIEWSSVYDRTISNKLSFEGFTCGDSEKKMVEHIISKYGLKN